jgi:putative transposase
MANTYTQLHIQAVIAVQHRACVIQAEWEDELYKYITGIIKNHGHKLLAINGMPDQVHIFFGLRPSQSISDLMQDIKADSSKWINQKGFVKSKFSWQAGYGAFSYSKSHVNNVIEYINNQKMHHRKISFKKEYLDLLKKFEINYNEDYIFRQI